MTTLQQLQEDFETFGIQIGDDNEVFEKCTYLLQKYNLEAEQIAVCWLNFASKNSYDEEITKELLDQFEIDVLAKEQKTKTKIVDNANDGEFNGNISHVSATEDEDILAAYGISTPVSTQAKSENGANCRTPKSKRPPALSKLCPDSPLAPSLSQSPQSQRYSSRTNSGSVVASFGSQNPTWTSNANDAVPEVKCLPCGGETPLKASYTFMFEKLRDCAESLDETIFSLGEQLKEHLDIEETGVLRATTNTSSWFIGRICCDSVGRLNAASVLLEGDRENCFGASVQLDLSRLANYAIFPGQVIAVKGINPTGDRILAEELFNGKCLQSLSQPKNLSLNELQIRIACGPFTTSENLLFEPLSDLLKEIASEKTHFLILLGPLLDASHPSFEDPLFSDSFDSIVKSCLERIQLTLRGTNTKVLLVSSARDVSCPMVFPTPPGFLSDALNETGIQLLPDPSLVSIDGVVVSLTTNDVLMHISKEEISFPAQCGDRFARLSKHLLLQQSFYPLYPAPEDFPVCLENADINARLPVKPHIMILPSDFRGFVKEVEDCYVINPEKLSKGKVGGSYCKLSIASSDGKLRINSKILRI